jgi:hypothetical protein
MAKRFAVLDEAQIAFIGRQKIFFAATAAPDARVNVSPRGTDHFRVVAPDTVLWLDLTGSSAETAAHLRADGRLTVMFCAFDGPPLILRLYGRGRAIRRGTAGWAETIAAHWAGEEPPGARQIVRLDIDLVQTSCGFGVPLFEAVGRRDTLDRWAASKGEAGLADYRRRKNAVSLDGLPTGLVTDDEEPGEPGA